ncbi:MAG: hypothetical protein IRZ04_00635 [Rhodospirillales bacterium]|nr:hypothetical protein [Rhodospirillales bacterium]
MLAPARDFSLGIDGRSLNVLKIYQNKRRSEMCEQAIDREMVIVLVVGWLVAFAVTCA